MRQSHAAKPSHATEREFGGTLGNVGHHSSVYISTFVVILCRLITPTEFTNA